MSNLRKVAIISYVIGQRLILLCSLLPQLSAEHCAQLNSVDNAQPVFCICIEYGRHITLRVPVFLAGAF